MTTTMLNKSLAFIETKKSLDRIRKLTPKLNESERMTLELLLDKEAMADLKKSLKDAEEGRTVSLEKAKQL